MVVYASNPNPGKSEAGGFPGYGGKPRLQSEFQASLGYGVRLCLKNETKLNNTFPPTPTHIQTVGVGGTAVKNTGCSCKGHKFEPQHSHDGSQLPVTLVPGDLEFQRITSSSGL